MEEEYIAELVAQDFRRAKILQDFGIDIFTGAKRTLAACCKDKSLDVARVVAELKNDQSLELASNYPFDSWPIDFLSSYIVNRHHQYVYTRLPSILALAEGISDEIEDEVIGQVVQVIRRMARAMMLHLMKEETILFPFIEQMVEASKENVRIARPFFGTVNNPTEIMEIEHEHSWEEISLIRSLTSNYTLRGGEPAALAILYKEMQEFEDDLSVHLRLENQILFPKAILLEKQIGLS